MKVIEYSRSLAPDHRSVLTVGTFDGVHRGHRAVLNYLIERARITDGLATVVTFDPHPREIVENLQVPLLTSVAERAHICEKIGIDRFIVIPFTKTFSSLNAGDFVKDVLNDRIGMQEIVVGYDHAFGHGRGGDEKLLKELAVKLLFSVDVIPPTVVEQQVVSSSRIRESLEVEGQIVRANDLLGYEYGLDAWVVHGTSRGRDIGFPTANLVPVHSRKIIPADGVYAVRVLLGSNSTVRKGMMNVGVRPTFGASERTLEVHILDYDNDLYDQQLRVEFVEKLRNEIKFDGIEDLVRQLKVDRERCMVSLSEAPRWP